jgi:hypothetical protein
MTERIGKLSSIYSRACDTLMPVCYSEPMSAVKNLVSGSNEKTLRLRLRMTGCGKAERCAVRTLPQPEH